jgi:hypothetical protein
MSARGLFCPQACLPSVPIAGAMPHQPHRARCVRCFIPCPWDRLRCCGGTASAPGGCASSPPSGHPAGATASSHPFTGTTRIDQGNEFRSPLSGFQIAWRPFSGWPELRTGSVGRDRSPHARRSRERVLRLPHQDRLVATCVRLVPPGGAHVRACAAPGDGRLRGSDLAHPADHTAAGSPVFHAR